jgi:hypothetical protein
MAHVPGGCTFCQLLNQEVQMQRTILSCICATILATSAWAVDVVGTTVETDTLLGRATWTKANSPYTVKVPVTILEGDTLTIEAGVEVRFDTTAGIRIEGLLRADGADGDVIRLSKGTADYWGGITVVGSDSSWLNYVEITDVSGDVDKQGGLTVSSDTAKVSLSDCEFTDITPGKAGAINLVAGWLYMEDCLVSGDSSGTVAGGVNAWKGTLVMSDVSVSGNIGGGIMIAGATATIDNCLINKNTSTRDGAGLKVASGTATITDCTIEGNKTGANGGGVYAGGTTALNTCTISADTASMGGGIYIAGTVTTTDCIIMKNVALNGAGIASVGKSFTVKRTFIVQNSASDSLGGAAYVVGTRSSRSPVATFINCTLADNTTAAVVEKSGAIYLGSVIVNPLTHQSFADYSAAVVENCIAWDNEADAGYTVDEAAGGFTITYSDIEGIDGGRGNIDTDPLFVGVPPKIGRTAGSLVAQYALDAGSPCIDAGSPYAKDTDDSRSDMGATGGGADQELIPRAKLPESLLVKCSRPAMLAIANTGWADLTISDITMPKYFTTDATLPITILAGEVADVPVMFTPAPTGDTTGVATITSDDVHNSPAEVTLNGYAGVSVIGGIDAATWTADASPYVVAEACTIKTGQVITIEPDVDVVFADSAYIEVMGAIHANGTVAKHITFMLAKEDSFGWSGLRLSGSDSTWMTYTDISGSATPNIAGKYRAPIIVTTNAVLGMTRCMISGNTGKSAGAIYVAGGRVTVCYSMISGNTSDDAAINSSGTSLVLKNTSIDTNNCPGVLIHNGSAWISNSKISRNNAGSVNGAGISAYNNTDLVVYKSTIEANITTGDGGGMYFHGNKLVLDGSTFKGNIARNAAGLLLDSGLPYIERCTFTMNIADSNAGGIALIGKSAALKGCFLTKNVAMKGAGGAIYVHGTRIVRSPVVTLQNCTIAANHSIPGIGDGVYLNSVFYDDFIKINLTDNSSLDATDCIFWDNGPNYIRKDSIQFGSRTVRYCDVQAVVQYIGGANFQLDPLFVDPEMGDFGITGSSPCIDRGDPTSPKDPDGTRSDVGAVVGKVFVGIAMDETLKAESLTLAQNSPNPFNPVTSITFALPEASSVKLVIFNLQGQRVRTLISGHMHAGTHSVVWNGMDAQGRAVASGLYLYRLTDGASTLVRRMTLVR